MTARVAIRIGPLESARIWSFRSLERSLEHRSRSGLELSAVPLIGMTAPSTVVAAPDASDTRRRGCEGLIVELSENFRANTTMLEARAREVAAQEVDRANGIDQKAAGLMAAGLALLAAGVAFAATI